MISGHLAPDRRPHPLQGAGHHPPAGRAPRPARHRPQVPDPQPVRQPLGPRERRARRPARREHRRRRIGEVLDRVRLGAEARTPAKHLPHGQRQWLEIALLLANAAELVLLDEPTAGMTAEETARDRGPDPRAGARARPLDHRHRARHQLHPRPRRPRHRAPPGPRPHPGPVRGRRGGPAGARRLPGERLMALEVEGVTAGYGSITVLRDVSLRVAEARSWACSAATAWASRR